MGKIGFACKWIDFPHQKERTGANAYDTGVKFKKIENSDKGRLLEYIYTQWLKLLDR